MISRLRFIQRALTCLEEQVKRSASFPELLSQVRTHLDVFAPSSWDDLEWILNHRTWWMVLYKSVRKNPCLYLSMLIYAYEIKNGRTPEVNIVSTIDPHGPGTIGHCWITRNNRLIFPLPGDVVKGAEMIEAKDDLRYWLRVEVRAPAKER